MNQSREKSPPFQSLQINLISNALLCFYFCTLMFINKLKGGPFRQFPKGEQDIAQWGDQHDWLSGQKHIVYKLEREKVQIENSETTHVLFYAVFSPACDLLVARFPCPLSERGRLTLGLWQANDHVVMAGGGEGGMKPGIVRKRDDRHCFSHASITFIFGARRLKMHSSFSCNFPCFAKLRFD